MTFIDFHSIKWIVLFLNRRPRLSEINLYKSGATKWHSNVRSQYEEWQPVANNNMVWFFSDRRECGGKCYYVRVHQNVWRSDIEKKKNLIEQESSEARNGMAKVCLNIENQVMLFITRKKVKKWKVLFWLSWCDSRPHQIDPEQ